MIFSNRLVWLPMGYYLYLFIYRAYKKVHISSHNILYHHLLAISSTALLPSMTCLIWRVIRQRNVSESVVVVRTFDIPFECVTKTNFLPSESVPYSSLFSPFYQQIALLIVLSVTVTCHVSLSIIVYITSYVTSLYLYKIKIRIFERRVICEYINRFVINPKAWGDLFQYSTGWIREIQIFIKKKRECIPA